MRTSRNSLLFIASTIFVVGLMAACSSSSGTPSFSSLCTQYCNKCGMDGGAAAAQTCASSCESMTTQYMSCSNEAKIATSIQACINMSACSAIQTCIETTVLTAQCQSGGGSTGTATGGTSGGGTSGTGTGGTTGSAGHAGSTGGTTGSAGSSGTAATCAACDKAMACCTASGQPATTCSAISAATCNQASGTTQANLIAECQAAVAAGAAQGIAGCM